VGKFASWHKIQLNDRQLSTATCAKFTKHRYLDIAEEKNPLWPQCAAGIRFLDLE